MKKRIVALLLTAAMCAGLLAGCGKAAIPRRQGEMLRRKEAYRLPGRMTAEKWTE